MELKTHHFPRYQAVPPKIRPETYWPALKLPVLVRTPTTGSRRILTKQFFFRCNLRVLVFLEIGSNPKNKSSVCFSISPIVADRRATGQGPSLSHAASKQKNIPSSKVKLAPVASFCPSKPNASQRRKKTPCDNVPQSLLSSEAWWLYGTKNLITWVGHGPGEPG